MAKKYFHNFNGVRFYLALLVIFHHIEEIKSVLGLPNIFHDYKFFMPMGTSAVTMFFTLSGFLISYFLFLEKDKSTESKISLRKFYRSRVVRIWPLYFLCVFIYWILVPHSFLQGIYDSIFFKNVLPVENPVHLSKTVYFGMYMVLLPQLAGAIGYAFNGMALYGGHFWSIGSEELYYLFWPLLVNKYRSYKKIFITGFAVVYAFFGLLMLLILSNRFHFHNRNISSAALAFLSFLYLTRTYCMLIGALFGYLYIRQHRWVRFLTNKITVAAAFLLFVVMVATGIELPVFVHEIYAILSAIILLHLTQEDVQYKWLENHTVSYFGSITYGVYLYHIIVIVLFAYLGQLLGLKNLLYFNLFVYSMSYFFSFFTAHLSYKYYETKFLRFK